jgi:hypothetical protein
MSTEISTSTGMSTSIETSEPRTPVMWQAEEGNTAWPEGAKEAVEVIEGLET